MWVRVRETDRGVVGSSPATTQEKNDEHSHRHPHRRCRPARRRRGAHTSNAQALPAKYPEPTTASRSVQANLRETILQLLDEGRQATTVAQRRLIHQDLVQTVRDGE